LYATHALSYAAMTACLFVVVVVSLIFGGNRNRRRRRRRRSNIKPEDPSPKGVSGTAARWLE